MSWKATFDKGVTCFRRGALEEALTHINQAGPDVYHIAVIVLQIQQAAELQSSNFIIYDSRAAVHEKLGDVKAALRDSKRVIDLAPERWQGYARSARLFNLLGKHSSAIKMADHALSLLRPEDVQRRTPLVELREKAVTAQAATETQRLSQVVQNSYLLGKLPVETLVEVFTILISEDHIWAIKLSHVCGHWRRILINTPSAWQTLVLSNKHPLRKAKLWQERTGNRIARISVILSDLDRASVFAQLQDLSWNNLSSLRISSKAFSELCHMLTGISLPNAFSNLDELSLLDCTSTDQFACCLSGPEWKLRILRLHGSIDMKDEWWQRIQQLKELHIDGFLSRFSTLVFTANPSLETLVFNCAGWWLHDLELGNGSNPTPMVDLQTIECRGLTNPFQLLRIISAPSITRFSVHLATVADGILLHLASRTSLVELRITNCGLDPLTLPTLLSTTPNLQTLQVNAIQAVVNNMFQFLTSRGVEPLNGLPCRALEHVDVSQCSDLGTSSVYAFVKTRVQYASESIESGERCAAIVSLRVDGCPNIEPDMLPWFRSKVPQFSCVYATKKQFRKHRR